MHSRAILLTTALALASPISAWYKDQNGVWIADNRNYECADRPDGPGKKVHVEEACTHMGTRDWFDDGLACAYWDPDRPREVIRGECRRIFEGHIVACVDPHYSEVAKHIWHGEDL